MPKLSKFKIKINTSDQGTDEQIKFGFNGHFMAFENIKGETTPGGCFEGEFMPFSVVHSLVLVGPQKGEWKIDKIEVEYEIEYEEPYSVTFEGVTLSDGNQLNIWEEKSADTFDV